MRTSSSFPTKRVEPGSVAASAQMSNMEEWLDAYTTGPRGIRSLPSSRTGVPAARKMSRDQSVVLQSYTPPVRCFTPSSAARMAPVAWRIVEPTTTT